MNRKRFRERYEYDGACLRNPKNVLLGLGLKGSLTWFLAFHFP
jgi:hypothetical protein